MNQGNTPVQRLLNMIDQGSGEYQNWVLGLTDEELWKHCFESIDIEESDFCYQEWKRRVVSIGSKPMIDAIKSLLDFCDIRFGNQDEIYNEIRKNCIKLID